MLKIYYPPNFRYDPLSLLRIEPFPTLLFDPKGHKKSNSFGVAFFVIPLGLAQPRDSRTLSLSLRISFKTCGLRK